ncbi:MAG: hypothetical protein RMK57_04820 [Bryobacterales bacterium]|nr:hypothetical protein [Bryobacteraceae bacterium]MDW8353835.1 hypothetical protein [Bryobacterales bacterium]
MFALRLMLVLESPQGERPVPQAWLEQFFLRDFTGYRAFDETLPVADGVVEASRAVRPEEAAERLQDWLRSRRLIDRQTRVRVAACRTTAGDEG